MKYLAYGSNLNVAQMEVRCPGAQLVASVRLKGWQLVFRGTCDMIPREAGVCYGAIWEITEACEAALDRYEGVKLGLYRKAYLQSKPFGQVLYYTMPDVGFDLPSPGYYERVEEGYGDCGLPVDELENALAFTQKEMEREDEEMLLGIESELE